MAFPFLTTYDPPGASEGTLDPLGLYKVADQLAVELVPAVRERMQRIRFLTAMAVGAMVTEGLEERPDQRDCSPYLVWEWLVTEAIMGQGEVAKLIAPDADSLVPIPPAISANLIFSLGLDPNDRGHKAASEPSERHDTQEGA